eukprot:s2695_g2.t1
MAYAALISDIESAIKPNAAVDDPEPRLRSNCSSTSSDSENSTWLQFAEIDGRPPPRCFVNAEVEHMANEKNRALRYREIAGPAYKLLFETVVASVLGPTVIFILVYWGSSCENGMDKPVPYWIWFCALPFAVLHFVQEVRIFRYTVVPYFQVVGRFQMLKVQMGPELWILINAAKSLAFQGAVFSNAVFAARTFATSHCPLPYHGHTAEGDFSTNTSFDEIWQITLRQSSFVFFMRDVPLSAQVLFFWLLSFAPLIHAILESLPSDQWIWELDFTLDMEKPNGQPAGAADNSGEYQNFLGGTFTFGDSVMMLSSGLGMYLIDEQSPSYPRAKTYRVLDKLLHCLKKDHGNDDKAVTSSQEALNNMRQPLQIYTRNALTRCFLKVITLGLFNSALQIHVQISVYAMFRATAQNKTVDFQRLVSIGLSLGGALFLLINVEKVLFYGHTAIRKVEDVMAHINESSMPVTWKDLKNYFAYRSAEMQVIRYRSYVRYSAITFVLCIGLAITKLCMVFRCPDSMWNLGSHHSCVDLASVLDQQCMLRETIWDLLSRKGAADGEMAPKWRYSGSEEAQGSPLSPSSQAHVDFEPPEGDIEHMEILRLLQARWRR